MPSVLRSFFSRSTRVGLVLAGLIGVLCCLSPLLGVQGYESALVLGLLLPPIAAWLAVRITHELRAGQQRASPSDLLEATLLPALTLWLVPCVVLALDSLRIRNCTPLQGFAFMVLGPGFGVMLAGLVGTWAGVALRGRLTATLSALAVPLTGILLALARFYATPSIFAYGHFFGFFSGTLYDEDVAIGGALLSLRVITGLWIAGLTLLLTSTLDGETLRVSREAARRRRSGMISGAALCALAASTELVAPLLGHAASVEHIRSELGGFVAGKRCDLYFPRELGQKDRVRLRDDCDFRVTQAERWLGVTHPARIGVYVFRSSDEKDALMGAARTNIAKPWRGEVYITHADWPHPVLWHELVHVVAARIGRGPFRIAGRVGGLWPDAALIEGVAVAAAWQAQGGLTPHEWARALLDLEMLPPLQRLFGLSFLGQQQRMAYTLSGSLLHYVAERDGSAVVRRAYMTGDLAGAVGMPLTELENAWREHLRALPMSPRTMALARARFSGGSIFSAICPHALASLREALRADLVAGDDASAARTCGDILDIDPNDGETRANLVGLLARLGDDARAQAQLDVLLAPEAPQAALAALARQAVADEAFRRGDRIRAAQLYEELLLEPLDDDSLRSVQVKALAARGDEAQARLLFELLVGAPGERSDPATAVHLTRELRALRSDGLALYLEGRQLFFQKRFPRAAPLLARSLALGLPTPELSAEAQRTAAIAAYASGDLATAESLFSALASSSSLGRAADANDWLARIRASRAH